MSSFSFPVCSHHLHTAIRKPRSPDFNLQRKPRLLCLHGFRTSGEILKKQLGKWPASVLDQLDLQFLDAPFPALGNSDAERFFDPPYFEWFQFNADFTEHRNLEECLSFIEDYMLNHEPFDGLLGFSQGATLSAALPGLHAFSRPSISGNCNGFFDNNIAIYLFSRLESNMWLTPNISDYTCVNMISK
ncbi:esterase FUS5-like [Cucurbita pepo subsp. pepo]|uniref:esterase FUS5-like n=1 Tax=Cucurbita pepo subsp. pepo TaxID=3664 RepID=UPI000C9D6E70|nr:esterase FUS5-like [Cucurbita pepo subsp. pepo]